MPVDKFYLEEVVEEDRLAMLEETWNLHLGEENKGLVVVVSETPPVVGKGRIAAQAEVVG